MARWNVSLCYPVRYGWSSAVERPASASALRLPVTTPPDDRSPAAKAYQWATRIMLVSLEMVLPGLLGYGLDWLLGTVIVFTLLGFAMGSWAAVAHLIRMTRSDAASGRNINK